MIDRRREAVLGAFVVAAALSGLLYNSVAHEVAAPAPPLEKRPFVQQATFCPSPVEWSGANTYVNVASASSAKVPVRLEPPPSAAAVVSPGRMLVHRSNDPGVEVVGYGASLAASATTSVRSRVSGAAAAPCSALASRQWYFPHGSTEIGIDERLVLYNPFPDEAVARITFFTPSGEKVNANLTDVGVPAGRTHEIAINEFLRPLGLASARVVAVRGRVVAWKTVAVRRRGRSGGIESSLGATRPDTTWYFPRGVFGEGRDERLFLLNPGDREAIVTITLLTDKGTVQPERLMEVRVLPRTSKAIRLASTSGAATTRTGVMVRSTGDAGVVAERTMSYATDAMTGVASEVGVTRLATQWLLGSPTMSPKFDSVAVMNPGSRAARVSITLLAARGAPKRPGVLTGVTVRAGSTRPLALEQWTKGKPIVALVSSSSPVVVERTSYSSATSDVADVMGVPVSAGMR